MISDRRALLQSILPRLKSSFTLTSPRGTHCNCIGWALEDLWNWWWPNDEDGFWPGGVHREETVQAFTEAFKTVGYEPCIDGALELGYTKIALYAKDGRPTHAARQTSDGRWTSKLGPQEDIRHESLEELYDGQDQNDYGRVACFLRKPEEG